MKNRAGLHPLLRTVRPALAALGAASLLAGCGRHFAADPDLGRPSGAIVPSEAVAPRALCMFEGSTGRALGWADLMAAASAADAVFIGERHGDPSAHALQLAVFEDLAAGYPGTALALEHLERNEQATLDRYLRGEIRVDEFIDSTGSRDWAGKDTWVRCYQPLVDAAREAGSPVIAANAPREFVRRARSEGHAALASLQQPERGLFEVPLVRGGALDGRWTRRWDEYQARFREVMAQEGDDLGDAAVRARLDEVFLSQSIWDATMGCSAARALESGAPKVVVCAGGFHIERDGGTVLQFEARRPRAKVLTIAVIDESSRRLREEDRLKADVVVYGFPVVRKTVPEAPTEPAPQPAPNAPATPAAAPPAAANPAQTEQAEQTQQPVQPSQPSQAAPPAQLE